MGQTKKDRRREGRHVRIYHKQMVTDAWRDLSGSAVKVLLCLASFENSTNNGEIFFSGRIGAERTGLARNTVRDALAELIQHGFLYCTEQGGFSRKTPHASTYGLTWLAGPLGEHRAPSHAYEKWKPHEFSRAQFLTETGSVSDTCMETASDTGADFEPAFPEKPVVSVDRHMSGIEPQTVSQGLGFGDVETEPRKQANPDRAAFLANLRTALCDWLNGSEPGTQTKVAEAAGIPGGTLSKFKNGGNLADNHAAALARWLLKEAA